ncbi:conserved hypothetical protein [Candidatus Terasakiella magnetica]|uniref:Zinc finger/thioredoxin putative domain-containing protein n=1 Tax=Candidatus Terasakiella magnetica TaxID=1867952 RepID=A0A1C3RIN1_9PROT|nr:DUF3426 domain-containing protein [Candidatus Terasakiella magnetica]SCA57128.1 conserved hypothetical protein [Candidatus Terasakiella magnetica]
MIVSCPSCSAHYSVPLNALGEDGRTLRCAKCGHSWEQLPYDDTVLDLNEHEETAAPPPPPPAPKPIVIPDPEPEPEPEPEPVFAPEPEPEPEPEPAFEPEPEPELEATPEPVSASDSFDTEDMPSDEELNDIFGDTDDIEPMESMAESMYSSDDVLDDVGDSDDIPDVFTAPVRLKEKKKKGGFFKFLFWLIVLIGILGSGVHFGRPYVMQYVPQAGDYYKIYDEYFGMAQEMMGMKPKLSEMMQIRDVHSSRRKEGNDDILVIAGDVGNISETTQMIPQLRVSLYDATDQEVQFVVVDTKDKEVASGGTTPFEALIKNPVSSARRLQVTFMEAEMK